MTTNQFGPYTPIRQADNFYFISGQVGVNPDTKQAGATIQEQAKQALDNLASVLKGEGLTMDDIVKTTVFLTNMDHYGTVNEIYTGYFAADKPRPARSAVGVAELPRVGGDVPILVEVEAVACKTQR